MRLTRITGTVDCQVFRGLVYHYQAQELVESDIRKMDEHVDGCERCSSYLEVENSFLRALKSRIPTAEAPAGLENRIRTAIDREAPRVRGGVTGWLRSHGLAAQAAAAVVLVGLLSLVPIGQRLSPETAGTSILRLVGKPLTVVDHECDRAGRTPEQQRACRNRRHLNVFKAGEGQYFHINMDNPLARDIVLDPAQRGRLVLIDADYYPEIHTVKLISLRDPSRDL